MNVFYMRTICFVCSTVHNNVCLFVLGIYKFYFLVKLFSTVFIVHTNIRTYKNKIVSYWVVVDRERERERETESTYSVHANMHGGGNESSKSISKWWQKHKCARQNEILLLLLLNGIKFNLKLLFSISVYRK